MVTRKPEYILGGLWVAASSLELRGRVSMRTFIALMAAALSLHYTWGPPVRLPLGQECLPPKAFFLFLIQGSRSVAALQASPLVLGALRMWHFGMPL